MSAASDHTAEATHARRAVASIFFVNGAVLASWVPHIPAVKSTHAMSEGELGVVLLAMAAGALLTMPLTGRLVDRVGSRRTTSAAALALCVALPFPLLSPDVPSLAGALFFLGACNGALDVSMNAQAVAVEQRYRRTIMSSFHALFSLGGLAGAGIAGVTVSAGVKPVTHVLVSSGVAVSVTAVALRGLLPSPAGSARRGVGLVRPSRALVALGTLAFFGLVAEGAMADWSAVYLNESLGASPAIAACGFAAFSLAMAAGRLSGDLLVARLGAGTVLRLSSVLASFGLGFALLIGETVLAIVGCGAVGLGIANVIPVLFSSAGNARDVAPGAGLAAVATIGYLGFLAGPPLIGVTAELTSLPIALGIVSAFCALIALSASVVEPPAQDATWYSGSSKEESSNFA